MSNGELDRRFKKTQRRMNIVLGMTLILVFAYFAALVVYFIYWAVS